MTAGLGCVVAALLAILAAAPAARAGDLSFKTVVIQGQKGDYRAPVAVYIARPGERNVVTTSYDTKGVLHLRDAAGVAAPASCRAEADGGVACAIRWLASIEVSLLDGDDELSAGRFGATADGGGGDDVLTGAGRLEGGAGDDRLRGMRSTLGAGAVLAGGPGADLLDPGTDGALDYSDHLDGVSVDLRGDEAAGSPGEGDRVLAGATDFYGGPGNDRARGPDGVEGVVSLYGGGGDDAIASGDAYTSISGGSGDDLLTGGRGRDSINGGTGSDRIFGAGGDDKLIAGEFRDAGGHDVLDGGDGDDYLLGTEGDDVLIGGAGRDQMIGLEGRDQLLADDGAADLVTCNDWIENVPTPGPDFAELDPLDTQRACGTVRRSGPAGPELLGAVEVRRDRRWLAVRAFVACPAAAGPGGCRALLRAYVGRRLTDACMVQVPSGTRRQVRLAAAPTQRERIRERRVFVRLAARDAAGQLRRQEQRLWPPPLAFRDDPPRPHVKARAARCG